MTLLAASFAVWGINDIFRGFGRSTLATVGNVEIPIESFRRAYDERLQQINRQIGHPLPPDQAKAIGLDRQVLGQMVAEAALDQRARKLWLGLSNAEIVRRVTTDPAFQTGRHFDRARFEQVLHNAGFTEQRFIAEQRQALLRRQIVDSIAGGLSVPKAWLDAINQYQKQERNVEYVTLGTAQAGEIPAPGADELDKYFNERKILFRAPEYRKIVTVAATPADLAKWMEIPEADVKAAFEEHRSRYVTPERRRVEQIVFPSMAEAEAAEGRIKGGLTFAALAAERGLKETDIDLGTVPKTGILDPAVADAAFALKEGEVSAPVKGRFGAIIVTVLKIEPEEAKTFAEVAPQIRADIAAERAKAQVQSLHEKIEDERAGGSSLEQAAQKLQLKTTTFEVDRSGRDMAGKPIADLPRAGDVVAAAFASDVGVDNDPIDADGGYLWYDVAGITPARDRTLDEVRKEVEERWRADQIKTRLQAKSAELVDKLKAGGTLDALAKADELKVETADKLTRGKPTANLSGKIIEAVFHTAKDAFGSSPGDNPDQWIVFRVTDITTPPLDANSAEAKRMDETIQRQMADDLFGQYVAALEKELGTTINQAVLAQALSGGGGDTGGGGPSMPDFD